MKTLKSMEKVHMKNESIVKEKIEKLAEGGSDKLQVRIDF